LIKLQKYVNAFKMMKTNILMAVIILTFATGCGSIKMKNDGGMLNVDAGEDKTAFVGDTVDFDGTCSVKGGLFQREACWDFGDGTGEDGITATHVYTEPGDYTAELTVEVVYLVTISASDDVQVKINPLPAEAFLNQEESGEYSFANQMATFLPDGRMVITGTVNPEDPSEIAVAVETIRGIRLLKNVTSFIQQDTGSYPDEVKAKDNENIIISAGEASYNVCLGSGIVNSYPRDASVE
jgi:hypothetical protein